MAKTTYTWPELQKIWAEATGSSNPQPFEEIRTAMVKWWVDKLLEMPPKNIKKALVKLLNGKKSGIYTLGELLQFITELELEKKALTRFLSKFKI